MGVQRHGPHGPPTVLFAVVVEQGVFFVGCAGAQTLFAPLPPLRSTEIGYEPPSVELLNPVLCAERVGGCARQHDRPTLLEEVSSHPNGVS